MGEGSITENTLEGGTTIVLREGKMSYGKMGGKIQEWLGHGGTVGHAMIPEGVGKRR